MESQPQNPEFRINPENFHPWKHKTHAHNWSNNKQIQFSFGFKVGLLPLPLNIITILEIYG